MAGPLEQFEVKPIVDINVGGLDLSFTNSSAWMVLAATVVTFFLIGSMRGRALVPTRVQSMAELTYELVANMVRDNVGSGGRPYFPFIFTLFTFILFGNLLGLIPGSFTFTSHIIVTFAMAAVVFVGITIIGIVKHKARFLRLFLPAGAPWWTAIILIPVELMSYLSRPFSLAVRLFANMTVGHLMLKVIAGFIVPLGVFGLLPLTGLVAVYALEVLIAIIQAYVFTILSCIYLHEALHLH